MIQIEYIANFIGVDISNKLIVKDIAEIKNKEEFIAFIQSSFKHMSLQYLNPLQKLNQFKKLYEKTLHVEHEKTARDEAYRLNEKVKNVSVAVRNELYGGKKPNYDNIKEYFTAKDKQRLEQLGNLVHVVSLADSNFLEEKLRESFIKKIYAVKSISASNKALSLNVKRF